MKTITRNDDINYRLKSRIYLMFPDLESFATVANCTKSYVSHVINKRRELPSGRKSEWARILGCFSDDIF